MAQHFDLAQLQALLRQAGWPDIVINTMDGPAPLIPMMASIAQAESSGWSNAHNPSGEDSWGLLQVNRRAWPQYSAAQLQDPLTNLQIALQIYNIQGLRAWGPSPDSPSRATDSSYLTRGEYNRSLSIYYAGNSAAIDTSSASTDDGTSFETIFDFTDPPTPIDSGIGVLPIVIAVVASYFVARELGIL
jgi:hypothetical protein